MLLTCNNIFHLVFVVVAIRVHFHHIHRHGVFQIYAFGLFAGVQEANLGTGVDFWATGYTRVSRVVSFTKFRGV
uniref:Putative secreted protein n=1 Tax=Anopheles darlingi TaxID=43151 RepID=A0A2M4DDZ9_ANODA